MLACLIQDATATDYKKAPRYFDNCRKWWERLTPDELETARTVIDFVAGPHGRRAAQSIAASLPLALRCPL